MKETSLTVENDNLQSKVISFLRFPMIVAVVLIHTQIYSVNGIDGNMIATYPFDGVYPIYESVLYLFTKIFTRVAVPLFFMFSGFLFFYKVEEFSIATYFGKLRKRIHTLLIPYIFWNILFFIVNYLSHLLFPEIFKSSLEEGSAIKNCLIALWDYNKSGYPINFPFWFIRDLIVVIVFTPVIYWLTKKLKYLFSILLGILWLTGCWFDVTGLSLDAFLFFSLGAYFSISKYNFVIATKSYSVFLGVLYLVCVIIAFNTRAYDWNIYIRRIDILLGIVFVLAISAKYIAKGKLHVNSFLSEGSFFIFAYHAIALPIVRRILTYIIPCTTDIRAVILYFLWALIIVLGGLLLYYLLRRYLPKTTAFITGGR